MAGIVFYSFMPALGTGAFLLGRAGRRQAEAGSPYRLVATLAMFVGIAQVVISLILAVVVVVIFLTS